MDVIHPNVPETIKRLADAYEYTLACGGRIDRIVATILDDAHQGQVIALTL